MADNDFPSGPWTGYYQYPDGRRGGMDLRLSFSNGRIDGAGLDELGGFSISGSYDAGTHEASWTKSYATGHAVEYRGFREGPVPGIWGTWHIPGNWSGGFHIWPLADDSTPAEEQSTEEPLIKAAPARPRHVAMPN